MTRRARLAFLAIALLTAAGCGDAEVCGAYTGGNVGVVKKCDRTVVVGEGQSSTEPNEPNALE